jgi:hypothetical protein
LKKGLKRNQINDLILTIRVSKVLLCSFGIHGY